MDHSLKTPERWKPPPQTSPSARHAAPCAAWKHPMRISVKVFDGRKRIVNISNVVRLKQRANLNPKLIFRGPLATALSNVSFPGEGVVGATPEVGAEPAGHLTPAPPIV